MALSMYLHMLCRSAINPLILIFSKNYFCEKNGKLDFSHKICTARVQKRQYFFFAENFAEQTIQTYLQGSKLTENSIKKVREAVSTPSKF